jgi:hypothetical protein
MDLACLFGTPEFQKTLESITRGATDVEGLRERTLKYLMETDTQNWVSQPICTVIQGMPIPDGSLVTTKDAFGKDNGSQLLTTPQTTERLIKLGERPAVLMDLRASVREIEDRLFNQEAHKLVAWQLLDFGKQDGLTEILEANEAMQVERAMNDSLWEKAQSGVLDIPKAPIFVGCVSNFSNFLDLCKKTLRSLELGIHVIVMSRSNTAQHCFRWFELLLDACKLVPEAEELMARLTFFSGDIESQRTLMKALPLSPMFFTGNRTIAARIKEVNPKLLASTGGPNTMVIFGNNQSKGENLEACLKGASLSHFIENKGQCTALRQLIVPANFDMTEVVAQVLPAKDAVCPQESLRAGLCDNVLTYVGMSESDKSYTHSHTHYRINSPDELPAEIEEHWREFYLDFGRCSDFSSLTFRRQLVDWLNDKQPISFSVNNCGASEEEYVEFCQYMFENTGLVVYTLGTPNKPALSCQARPQDGEIFGELPPRREMFDATNVPVSVPSNMLAYYSTFTPKFLCDQSTTSFPLSDMVHCEDVVKGYLSVLYSYLQAASGPKMTGFERPTLYGVQNPPGRTLIRVKTNCAAKVWPTVYAFLVTSARTKVTIVLEDELDFPDLRAVLQHLEIDSQSSGPFWNEIQLMDSTDPSFFLPSYFIFRFFPFGHLKLTDLSQAEFLKANFLSSPKWMTTVC